MNHEEFLEKLALARGDYKKVEVTESGRNYIRDIQRRLHGESILAKKIEMEQKQEKKRLLEEKLEKKRQLRNSELAFHRAGVRCIAVNAKGRKKIDRAKDLFKKHGSVLKHLPSGKSDREYAIIEKYLIEEKKYFTENPPKRKVKTISKEQEEEYQNNPILNMPIKRLDGGIYTKGVGTSEDKLKPSNSPNPKTKKKSNLNTVNNQIISQKQAMKNVTDPETRMRIKFEMKQQKLKQKELQLQERKRKIEERDKKISEIRKIALENQKKVARNREIESRKQSSRTLALSSARSENYSYQRNYEESDTGINQQFDAEIGEQRIATVKVDINEAPRRRQKKSRIPKEILALEKRQATFKRNKIVVPSPQQPMKQELPVPVVRKRKPAPRRVPVKRVYDDEKYDDDFIDDSEAGTWCMGQIRETCKDIFGNSVDDFKGERLEDIPEARFNQIEREEEATRREGKRIDRLEYYKS
ncbi:unnamed protein product [Moneuplotes crassus]|uniref:Uncharacterized protein n=1 Tax=Euplotes crassus TaxID=5936 RepID=A0AAD1UDG8_EUPCR|nr:unnamed protein product [Moneuplotes crassus]